MRLVQLARGTERCLCIVEEPFLRVLDTHATIYSMALAAAETDTPLRDLVEGATTAERLDYDAIYDGRADWRILPAIDHPAEPARLLVSGTGLTHKRSAEQRQAMHAADARPTDSLRMYEWGVEGGRPATRTIGTAPEWFYKGNGTLLRGHGEALTVPAYADDGGEEPEI